jgi:hypothetical protein
MIITIWRPSKRASDSTLAISAVSAFTRFKSLWPSSWWAISRPLKRRVTFEEALDGLHLDLIIVVVDHRAHLDLLDLNDLLLLAGLGGLLLFLEFVLAVIEDFGNRGNRVRRDFDQIEVGFLGHCQGLTGWHDSNILSVGSDEAHFARINTVVNLVTFFFLRGGGTAYNRWPPWGYAQVFCFSLLWPYRIRD